MCFPRSVLIVLIALALPGPAGAQALSIQFGTLEAGALRAEQVELAIVQGGAAELAAARVRHGNTTLRKVRVQCPRASLAEGRFTCKNGRLSAEGVPAMPVELAADAARGQLRVALHPARGERWQLEVARRGRGGTRLELQLESARVERLARFLPAMAEEGWRGQVSGTLRASVGDAVDSVGGTLRAHKLEFSRANGTQAVAGFDGTLTVDAERRGGAWKWQGAFDWSGGEAYLQPLYVAGGGWRLSAAGTLQDDVVAVSQLDWQGAGIGELRAAGRWDLGGQRLLDLRVDTGPLDLARLGSVLVAPLLEQRGIAGVSLSGSAQAAVAVDATGLSRIDLQLEHVGVGAATKGVRLDDVTGRIPWQRDGATAAQLRVGGAMLGRLPIGTFSLDVAMRGYDWRIASARVPVLDATLHLRDLAVRREAGQWRWEAGADLEPVSMPQLTELFGLPRMAGSLGATLPRVSYADRVMTLDGAMLIQVFDGYLRADALQLIEPLGRLPRLTANVEAHHLDLGQLTETFRFGRITGFVDASVTGLELANWRPLAFDARIASSPGRYPKRISQRAVEDIAALGGAGATLAIQRSFLRFFDRFGYSAIGWRCVLRDGVCTMDGLEPAAGGGYVIVRGGGVPALNVIGYNRRVDWAELVSRLKRITAEGAAPVIR